MSDPPEPAQQANFEIIDKHKLAERTSLPLSWIEDGTRSRAIDPIPCGRFGKYVRFRWNSPELNAWIDRHFGGTRPSRPRRYRRTVSQKAVTA